MAIQLDGIIKASDINVELDLPSTQIITLGSSIVRGLIDLPLGVPVSLSQFYGATNILYVNIDITANTQNLSINPNTIPAYEAGKTVVTVTIAPNIVVGSVATAYNALGVSGFVEGADVINIINNGYIVGAGGRGGNSNTNNAGGGGPALYTANSINVTNNGVIAGGGGGGGARQHTTTSGLVSNGKTTSTVYYYYSGSPGGGGAGSIVGQAGTLTAHGNSTPAAGSAGSLTTGGAGGSTKSAGAGGALGSNGVSGDWAGGAGGLYIVGNSLTNWIKLGTVSGRVG